MILWAVRANRPGRAEDVRLLADMSAAFAARPKRRRPAVVLAATCIDCIEGPVEWPSSGGLSRDGLRTVAEVSSAIAADMGATPIPLALTKGWNTAALLTEVEVGLAPALMVQRNRERLEGEAGMLDTLRASGAATVTAGAAVTGRMWARISPFGGLMPKFNKETNE